MAEPAAPRHGWDPHGDRRGGAHLRTGGAPGTRDDLSRVDDWADQLRTEAASQLRRREQWLRRQAAEDTCVAGVLVDHAEHGSTLAITTRSGNRHVGQVRGAGAELVTLDITGACVVIELDGIETIRAMPGTANRPVDPMGHRSRADDTTMADVLGSAVAARPDVTLVTRSGEHVSGELMAVGRDLAMVRPPEQGPLIYVPVASVSEALLPASTGSGYR